MILTRIARAVGPHGLKVMGHTGTHVLIGTGPAFWTQFTQAPEYGDGARDPLDRWSKRVLGTLANQMGAQAVFPSDGPPYAPFISWALATGRFWQSPTGMMVHDTAGLMISIRGALEFDVDLGVAALGTSPCETCVDRPCVAACPVDALSDAHFYDVPTCKAYLTSPEGTACMTLGCHVRRACPVSVAFDRPAAQSAFHMDAFAG